MCVRCTSNEGTLCHISMSGALGGIDACVCKSTVIGGRGATLAMCCRARRSCSAASELARLPELYRRPCLLTLVLCARVAQPSPPLAYSTFLSLNRNIPALGRIGDPDDIIASVRVEEGEVCARSVCRTNQALSLNWSLYHRSFQRRTNPCLPTAYAQQTASCNLPKGS